MRIENVKINGLHNPVGYLLESVRCSWKVVDTKAKKPRNSRIEVSDSKDFLNIVYRKEGEDLNQASERLELSLEPYTCYYVRISVTADNGEKAVSDSAYFETSKGKQPWIGQWITTQREDIFHPTFCKSFVATKTIKSARLYILGLGLFEAFLNGKKIGNEVLTPYYSNYHDEIQYLTFDLTEALKNSNELEVSLGNGWYKGRFGLAGKSENFGSRFQVIAEIRLVYEDGTVEILGSDESWNYKGSDIESSDIYDGEVLNHRLWDGKNNSSKSAVLTEVEGKLIERYSLPLLEMEELPVKEIIYTPAGETVLDFGQNFAGYPSFYSKMSNNTKVVLDFGEILQHGNFYNENYRSAKSQFSYVSDGREEWVKPRFTYFGFRYVRVSGWEGELKCYSSLYTPSNL